ncbi:hypothetical protein HDU91_002944, partial [Kappamyces sp. JEL0680]
KNEIIAVRDYVNEPLSKLELVAIQQGLALAKVPASALVRWDDQKDKKVSPTEDQGVILELLLASPMLLQRPLLLDNETGRCVVGRPDLSAIEEMLALEK